MAQSTHAVVTRIADVEVRIERRFTSPPAKVFAALTEPALLRRWMNAGGRELVETTADVRTGGSYRYVFKSPKGSTFTMYGSYPEVVPGKRIVHTEAYEGYDWKPLVTTTELVGDGDAGTKMVMTIRYPTKEICDTDFPNIQEATAEGFNRLDAVLASP